MPQPVATTSYNAANQQTVFGAQTVTYDNNGNLTSDGINAYGWNARNQLVSMSGPALAATFQYDVFGRRISKTINSAMTSFLYDGVKVAQEQTESGNTSIVAGGIYEVFTRTDSISTVSPIGDRLGSAAALSDSTGAIQTQYTYEPFGKTAASGPSNGNTSQYTGRENDGTGLYYYRARYYSPALQRFISEDPIGFDGGDVNLFAYVANQPTMVTDPFGLQHPYEQITHNASKMGPLPLSGRSCEDSSNPDVKKIYDTYRTKVDELTRKGLQIGRAHV